MDAASRTYGALLRAEETSAVSFRRRKITAILAQEGSQADMRPSAAYAVAFTDEHPLLLVLSFGYSAESDML